MTRCELLYCFDSLSRHNNTYLLWEERCRDLDVVLCLSRAKTEVEITLNPRSIMSESCRLRQTAGLLLSRVSFFMHMFSNKGGVFRNELVM